MSCCHSLANIILVIGNTALVSVARARASYMSSYLVQQPTRPLLRGPALAVARMLLPIP